MFQRFANFREHAFVFGHCGLSTRAKQSFLILAFCAGCGTRGSSFDDGLGVLSRDASTTADASVFVADAAVDGRPRDIEITSWMIDQGGDDGGERNPLQVPRLADVRAQWRWADGGWGSSQAEWLEDAGYLIRAVPEGDATCSVPRLSRHGRSRQSGELSAMSMDQAA
ncbi:MAG: hypothetical protein ABTQ32_23870 [Myxococcaceae bacterium]